MSFELYVRQKNYPEDPGYSKEDLDKYLFNEFSTYPEIMGVSGEYFYFYGKVVIKIEEHKYAHYGAVCKVALYDPLFEELKDKFIDKFPRDKILDYVEYEYYDILIHP